MKLVNETRRSAEETPPVQPVFDVDEAERSIRDMITAGGYNPGLEAMGRNPNTQAKFVQRVADAVREKSAREHPELLDERSSVVSPGEKREARYEADKNSDGVFTHEEVIDLLSRKADSWTGRLLRRVYDMDDTEFNRFVETVYDLTDDLPEYGSTKEPIAPTKKALVIPNGKGVKYRYYVELDGKAHGTITAKTLYAADSIKEKYNNGRADTDFNRRIEVARENLGGNVGSDGRPDGGRGQTGHGGMAVRAQRSQPAGNTGRSVSLDEAESDLTSESNDYYGYGTEEELLRAIDSGTMIMDENGDILPQRSSVMSNTERASDEDYAPTFYSQMARTIDEIKQQKLGAASVVSYDTTKYYHGTTEQFNSFAVSIHSRPPGARFFTIFYIFPCTYYTTKSAISLDFTCFFIIQ